MQSVNYNNPLLEPSGSMLLQMVNRLVGKGMAQAKALDLVSEVYRVDRKLLEVTFEGLEITSIADKTRIRK